MERLVGGDQGATLSRSLQHQRRQTRLSNESVAHGKRVPLRLPRKGLFCEIPPTAIDQFPGEVQMPARGEVVHPLGEEGGGCGAHIQGRLMNGRIDAQGKATRKIYGVFAQVGGQFSSRAKAVLRGLACADDR